MEARAQIKTLTHLLRMFEAVASSSSSPRGAIQSPELSSRRGHSDVSLTRLQGKYRGMTPLQAGSNILGFHGVGGTNDQAGLRRNSRTLRSNFYLLWIFPPAKVN